MNKSLVLTRKSSRQCEVIIAVIAPCSHNSEYITSIDKNMEDRANVIIDKYRKAYPEFKDAYYEKRYVPTY